MTIMILLCVCITSLVRKNNTSNKNIRSLYMIIFYFSTTKTYVGCSWILTTTYIMSSPSSKKNTISFIMNWLLATIGSTQPHLCILRLDKTLLNVTDIAMGLHLPHIPFDSIEGKCLVIADGILWVCHHIVMTNTTKINHIFICDKVLHTLSHTLVEFLLCIFFF